MNDIRKKQIEKQTDARLWTAAEAIEDLMEFLNLPENKDKKVRLTIEYQLEVEPEVYTRGFRTAGVTFLERIGMLEQAKMDAYNAWRGGD